MTLLKVEEIWAWPVASTLTTLFLVVVVFFAITDQTLLGCFLLVGNGLLLTLTGTCVVLGALATHRKTCTMADATVATDIHEALDVHLDGRAELTLDLVLVVDEVTDSGDLIVVPFTHFDSRVDAALVQDGPGAAAAVAEALGEAYISVFVVR